MSVGGTVFIIELPTLMSQVICSTSSPIVKVFKAMTALLFSTPTQAFHGHFFIIRQTYLGLARVQLNSPQILQLTV